MEVKYFLDWRPVSTPPIYNSIWKWEGLTIGSINEVKGERAEFYQSLFEHYKNYLLMFEYAMRRDGLFIFQIGLASGTPTPIINELSNLLSDSIKYHSGHIHDFHAFPFSRFRPPQETFKAKIFHLRKKTHEILNFLGLPNKMHKRHVDVDLHIHPVELEDPFGDDFRNNSNKNYTKLRHLIDPKKGDSTLSQLREKKSEMRACLSIRSMFAAKKELCFIAYTRRTQQKTPRISSIIWSAIAFILCHFVFNWGFIISSVLALGLYIYLYDCHQTPKRELIQRTIGFYAYANIYSLITEEMYRKASQGPNFNTNTGQFDYLIDILKAKLDIENFQNANFRYVWTLAFAIIATSFALFKLSNDINKDEIGANVLKIECCEYLRDYIQNIQKHQANDIPKEEENVLIQDSAERVILMKTPLKGDNNTGAPQDKSELDILMKSSEINKALPQTEAVSE